jgi:hypothetical protein
VRAVLIAVQPPVFYDPPSISEGEEPAKEVFLSDKTVKNYVSSILSKLNLRRRSEAAAFMAERRTKALDES